MNSLHVRPYAAPADFDVMRRVLIDGRRGLGRAAMLEGLRRLKALGVREAIVYAEQANPAAQALYRSVGFEPINRIDAYRRLITNWDACSS